MTATSLLFNIDQLNTEQQQKFHTVHNELKSHHASYLQYKLDLKLKPKFISEEEEENDWCYELYRYLRARKWNVAHTIKSILEMIEWRKDNHADSILEHEPTSLRIDLLRKIVPSAHHGYTKIHQPLYIEKSGQMSVDEVLNRFTMEEVIQCHIYWLEFNCQLARERSRQVGKHVENFALIYDLKGCKMDMRKVLHLFKQSVYIDDNYYPERLGQMFIVNPPMVFPALWNLVKYFLDPVTKTKIIVMKKGAETSTRLLQHIDSDHLPHEYGGNCHSCPTSPNCIPVYGRNNGTADDKQEEEEE